MTVGVRLLGVVGLCTPSRAVASGGPSVRTLLAALATHAGRPVGSDQLMSWLWDEEVVPQRPRAAIHTYVSRLRARLAPGEGRIAHSHLGYQLELAGESGRLVDGLRARDLLRRARERGRGGDPEGRRADLAAALDLFCAEPLTGLNPTRVVAAQKARWQELETALAIELALDGDAGGAGVDAIDRLSRLSASRPTHEELAVHLMRCLHAQGRASEAVEVFDRVRAALDHELGVAPGARLVAAHRQVAAGRTPPDSARALRPVRPESGHGGHEGSSRPPRRVGLGIPSPDRLFGRDEVLAAVQALLLGQVRPEARTVAVVGPPGAGTSAVALAAALACSNRFPGGVHRRSPFADDVVAEVTTAVRDQEWDRPDALLVVDGVTDLEQVQELTGTRRCKLLVVSSRRWGQLPGESVVVPVRRLGLAAGRTVLGRCLAGAAVDGRRIGGSATLDGLARLCEGLPVAMRVLACHLASGYFRDGQTALAALGPDPRRRLSELACAHWDLSDSIARAVTCCSEAEQRALLCLARTDHAAGASMDLLARRLVSAHACSGEGSARRRLFGLLDAHVLEVRGYRTDARPLLALAPSVQAFVTGQLAEVLDPTG